MHSSFLHTIKITLVGIALALFVVALTSLGGLAPDPARAAEGDNVSGWAWSDNIGWISFYGDNYGVNINDDSASPSYGAFSGYAWSDAIGWINFAPDASGAFEEPRTGASVNFLAEGDIKPVTGWARACSVLSSADCSGTAMKSNTALGGWDGWLKMSGTSPDYGVTFNTATNKFGGYAWGSDVVGWISMSGTSPDYAVVYGGEPVVVTMPSVTLSTPSTNVSQNTQFSITATIENLAGKTCTDGGSPNWWNDATVIPDDSEMITVSIPSGIAEDTTYNLTCDTTFASPLTVHVGPFIEFFTANGDPSATYVEGGPSVTLAWDTANVTSGTCSIDNGVGSVSLSGSAPVTPNTETIYEISCTDGTAFSNSPQRVTVHHLDAGFTLEPPRHEIKITTIGVGGVGTGGISDKAVFHVIADNNTVSTVALTVSLDPLADAPASYGLVRGTNYFYKFRTVPTADNTDGVASDVSDALTVNIDEDRFWDDGYEIEFWVESTVPLPPLSQNRIVVHGASGAATADVDINLDSRAFNPKYREI